MASVQGPLCWTRQRRNMNTPNSNEKQMHWKPPPTVAFKIVEIPYRQEKNNPYLQNFWERSPFFPAPNKKNGQHKRHNNRKTSHPSILTNRLGSTKFGVQFSSQTFKKFLRGLHTLTGNASRTLWHQPRVNHEYNFIHDWWGERRHCNFSNHWKLDIFVYLMD